MRTVALVLVLMVAVGLCVPATSVLADTGSISRDARGSTTYGETDPLGGPSTPKVYGFGQSTIFGTGIALLALAALLGAYTFVTAKSD